MEIHQENTYTTHLSKRVKDGELTEITEFVLEFQWLSNFYWHYRMEHTVEHHFQAAKAAGDDITLFNFIMNADTPGKAKRLGRRARLPAHWNRDRDLVMKGALLNKFNLSPMREWLLALGEIPLTEGNFWHDNYWGDCRCLKCKSTRGINRLGILLMEVRSELREQENKVNLVLGGFKLKDD